VKITGTILFENAASVKLLSAKRGAATLLVTQADGFRREYRLAVGDDLALNLTLALRA